MAHNFAVFAIVLTLTLGLAHSHFGGNDVVDLTTQNFKSDVLNSQHLWIVVFYAPWCGHCKALGPEFSKAATALSGIIQLGAVNMDEHSSLGEPYQIRGFPTLKFFGSDKTKPQDYNEARSAKALVDFALNQAQKIAQKRLNGGSGGSSSRSSSSTSQEDYVVELTEDNFQELVLDSNEPWLVEFFAPWCGHCKNLAPQWSRAAGELHGKVFLGAVDATIHSGLASQYGIKGYPTIKVFKVGAKSSPEDYNGGRTSSAIVNYALTLYEDSIGDPEIVELISQETLDECGASSLCMVSFLPHILDSKAVGRNKYLDILKKVASANKRSPVAFLWAEGGTSQTAMEQQFDVGGFGYPAVIVISAKKERYGILRAAFTENHLNAFIQKLMRGAVSTYSYSQAPVVVETDPWDGEDGQNTVEDEYNDDDEEDYAYREEL